MKLAKENSGRFAVVVVAKAMGSVGVDGRADCRGQTTARVDATQRDGTMQMDAAGVTCD
jgi:hypothetical protein